MNPHEKSRAYERRPRRDVCEGAGRGRGQEVGGRRIAAAAKPRPPTKLIKRPKEAEEKAEEAEEAVERETEGEGILPAARTIGLGAVEQLGGVQRSVQHRARSPQPAPTSPYAGAEAYTLAYSGAPPSQILAGAPPPLPPPVRNPTGPTSARENALEARELALEERLRYVEAMLAAKAHGRLGVARRRRGTRGNRASAVGFGTTSRRWRGASKI